MGGSRLVGVKRKDKVLGRWWFGWREKKKGGEETFKNVNRGKVIN